MANHSRILAQWELHKLYRKAKSMTPKDEPSRLAGVQCDTREEQMTTTNSSKKNEVAGPKQKRCSVVDVSGGEIKIWCCKKQYCIETWNVRSWVYVPQLSYPFICWWTSRLLLCPGYYKQCCDEWIRKLWCIYTMEYYSAIKKNTFESVLMRWMKLEPIIQSEVSQKEKHQYSILTHIYGI